MATHRVGKIYVELDLDKSRYMKAQQTLVRESATGARVLERNFRNLGIRSGATFDLMRNQAVQSYNAIRRSGRATADDLVRAARARAARIRQINEEQYGRHETMLKKMAKNWKMYAAMIVAAVGLAMRKVLTEYADFEVALNRLGNVSDESIGSMREKILNIAPALGTVTELTRGYYQVMSAGVTEPLRAMDLLRVSAKMSQEATIEQGEAVKGIASLMGAYTDELTNATEAADLLYKTEALGIIEVGQLTPLIGDLANKAKAVGLSTDEMAASLAQVSTTGAGASIAVTQLQSLLKSLSKGFDKLPESIQKYGSTINAVKAIGFQGVLKEMWAATDGNATAIQKMLGRAEAYSAYLQLSKNEFTEYADRLDQMTDKAGAFDDAWKRFSITLTSVWGEFKNTVGREAVLLGEELAPAIKIVVKDLSNWIEQNHELIGQKTHVAISKITDSIKTMIAAYNSLPDGVIGAAGTGILVRILTGSTPLGKAVAALYLLNVQLENFGVNMKKVGEYSERAINPLGVMLRSLAAIEKSPFFGGGGAGGISGAGRGFDIPSKPPSKPKPFTLSSEIMAEAKERPAALAKAMKEQLKIMEDVAKQVRKQIKERKDLEQRLRDDIYSMDVKYRNDTENEIRRVEKLRIAALEAERDKHAEVVKDKDLLNQWYGKRLALITSEATAKIDQAKVEQVGQVDLSTFQEIINLFSDSGEVFKGAIEESGELMFKAATGTEKAIAGAGEIFGMTTLASGLNFAVAIGEAVISILGVIEGIVNLPQRIVEAFTSLFITIGDFGKLLTNALDEFVASIPYMIEGLGDVFTKLIPRLIALVPDILKAALDAIPVLVDAVIDSIPLIVDALIKQIASYEVAKSATKSSLKVLGTGFDLVLKGLKSLFGGGSRYKYAGGAMDVGFAGGTSSAEITQGYGRRIGAEGVAATENAMVEAATLVLEGYQEILNTMNSEVRKTFYENAKNISVSVYAKATHSGALERRFGIGLENMATEITEHLALYLGEAIRTYGQSAISTISQMGLSGFLAPSADIFHQTKQLQKQLMSSADMSTDELAELVKQIDNLAKAAKNITKTWKDIQYQMKVAAGEVSQLDQEMYQVNQMFDTWREQMEALGATQQVLSEIEQNRAKAIERLMHVETRALEQIDKLLASLGATGEFAPVQSMEAYQVKYAALQQDVLSAQGIADIESAVDAMTAFIPDYIKFMEGYGGDYGQLIQGIQAEMETMRDLVSAMITTGLSIGEVVTALKLMTAGISVIEFVQLMQHQQYVKSFGHASGGLTSGLGFVGEKGPEWVIPTYEPERSSFLGNLGLSPEALGRAIAQNIGTNDSNQTVEVNVYIDGQPIRDVVTTGLRGRDTELIQAVRKAA